MKTKELFHTKRVALIGNAGYLKGTNQAKKIDSYDVVCRCNNYTLTKDVGYKTDVWFFSFHPKIDLRPAKVNLSVLKPRSSHRILDIEHEIIEDETLPERVGSWATTGCRAFDYILKFDFKELYLTGFSFKNTNYDYYNSDIVINQFGHDLNLEFKYLKKHLHRNITFDSYIKQLLGDNVH